MRVAGVLLLPGAGSDRDHRTLRAVEAALAAGPRPVPVRRTDFARRAAGLRGPERIEVAVPHVRAAADAWAAELGAGPAALVLGGRSFGGRAASMAVAQGQPAAGLLLLSYPLHPPGRPDRLRVEHLPHVGVPVLTVQGATDPFGRPAELDEHLVALAGPRTHVTVAGGHEPRDDAAVAAAVVAWVRGLEHGLDHPAPAG